MGLILLVFASSIYIEVLENVLLGLRRAEKKRRTVRGDSMILCAK